MMRRWLRIIPVVALVVTTGCDQLKQMQATAPTPSPAAAGTPRPAAQPSRQPSGGETTVGGVPVPGQLTVRDVADRLKPAVVQIVTDLDVGGLGSTIRGGGRATGVGTGVIFDRSGLTLTNNHVVADARRITVSLSDQRSFQANIVGTDPDTDLAVIKIQADNLPVATLGQSSRMAVGDGVVAIGHALGLPGGPTVTAGVVSALGRSVAEPSDGSGPGAMLYDAIQTDAAINPGNSGGPLANMNAEVIGINTLVAAQAEPGVPAQGIGFAIAIDTAKPIADELATRGFATHPYIGVLYTWAGAASAAQLGAPQPGVLVRQVVPGSPADRAGIQPGDLITRVDGQPLGDETALAKAVNSHRPGDTIQLTIVRGNQQSIVSITLAERPRSQ